MLGENRDWLTGPLQGLQVHVVQQGGKGPWSPPLGVPATARLAPLFTLVLQAWGFGFCPEEAVLLPRVPPGEIPGLARWLVPVGLSGLSEEDICPTRSVLLL